MRFRNFRVQIIIRILLLFVGVYGLTYYLFIEVNYIRVFFLGIFVIIIMLSIFAYLNSTNKDTRNFLQAIIHNDFTIKYNVTKKGQTFDDLYDTFNQVNQKFVESTQHDESEYQYMITLINQLQIGVLAYDEKDRVVLANDSFNELIGHKTAINLSSIEQQNQTLFEGISNIQNGENIVLKTAISGKVHRLSMTASTFILRQRRIKLVSFKDIHSELDQNEMEAWQKLIRVLTHEIMNSVSPITSLSSSLQGLVVQDENPNNKALKEGLGAIEDRSQGLMNFTQAYRSLTRVPLPQIRQVEPKSYFNKLSSLFEPTLLDTAIDWQMNIASDKDLMIDPELMEQVLINLLKNAKEAVDNQSGRIALNYFNEKEAGQVVIEVVDNGNGISDEVAEKIFIPFYTTKTEGSGIGLSLARQIVQLHEGKLSFNTNPDGTTFQVSL